MKQILILDDNIYVNRDSINKVMDCEDYCTITCGSIARAYEKLQKYKYDIIVVDIMMPCPELENKDEIYAGLNFYDEKMKYIDGIEDSKILFWSHLCRDSFDLFFGNNKPKNVDFLQKDRDNDNHLLEKIESMLNPKPKMTREELCDLLVELGYEDTILFENPSYVGAFIGVNDSGQACYQYEKMAECLMEEDNMTYEEAIEFIDYNTVRALPYCQPSDKRPIIIYPILD